MGGSTERHLVIAAALLAVLLVGSAAGSGGGLLAPGDTHGAETPVALAITGPESVEPGEPTTLSVEIRATQPVYGAEVSISHAPGNLSVNDVSAGGFLAQNGSSYLLASEAEGDTIEYAEVVLGEDAWASGNGTLATINLTVPESTTASTLSLSFEEVQIVGENNSVIDATATGTNITIAGRATATATATQTTATPTPPTESATETETETEGTETASDSPTATASRRTRSPTETAPSTATPTPTQTDATTTPTDTASAETSTLTTESGTASPTESNAWRRKVDSAVFDALEATGRAEVVVRPRPNGSIGEIRRLLNASGAADVRRLADPEALAAVVSAESLQPVAISRDVDNVSAYSANESPTETDVGTSGPTDTASAETSTRTTETASVRTTSTDAPTTSSGASGSDGDPTATDGETDRSATPNPDDGVPTETPPSIDRSATDTEAPLVPLGFVVPVGALLIFVAVRTRF